MKCRLCGSKMKIMMEEGHSFIECSRQGCSNRFSLVGVVEDDEDTKEK